MIRSNLFYGLSFLGVFFLFFSVFLTWSLRTAFYSMILSSVTLMMYIKLGHLSQYNQYEKKKADFLVLQSILSHKEDAIPILIEKMSKIVINRPNDFKAWFLLGKLHLMHNDISLAKKDFFNAYTINPNDKQVQKAYFELTHHNR
jgi:cytochrome c-type biogenesis protein CcmH/NrfG